MSWSDQIWMSSIVLLNRLRSELLFLRSEQIWRYYSSDLPLSMTHHCSVKWKIISRDGSSLLHSQVKATLCTPTTQTSTCSSRGRDTEEMGFNHTNTTVSGAVSQHMDSVWGTAIRLRDEPLIIVGGDGQNRENIYLQYWDSMKTDPQMKIAVSSRSNSSGKDYILCVPTRWLMVCP